jgi:hypothetical protein
MLPQGEVREVCFRVHNGGGRRLVIRDPNAACCGGSAESSSLLVAPGDFAEIRVQVDTSGWWGQMREDFSYATNDPRQPQLAFTVLGEVAAADADFSGKQER